MKVAAIVVTHNRKAVLLKCLESICKQTRPVDAIFIVDNASSDGTQASLRKAGFLPSTPSDPTDDKDRQVEGRCASFLVPGRTVVRYTRMKKNWFFSESVVASLENFQGKVAQVVIAVGLSFDDFDLVIDPFQKSGMDGIIAVV